jgi:hypothetical protein
MKLTRVFTEENLMYAGVALVMTVVLFFGVDMALCRERKTSGVVTGHHFHPAWSEMRVANNPTVGPDGQTAYRLEVETVEHPTEYLLSVSTSFGPHVFPVNLAEFNEYKDGDIVRITRHFGRFTGHEYGPSLR